MERDMKLLIIFILAFGCLTFTGCGEDNQDETTNATFTLTGSDS